MEVPLLEAAGVNVGAGSHHVRFHDTGAGRSSAGIVVGETAAAEDLQGVVAGAYSNNLAAVSGNGNALRPRSVISAGNADDQAIVPQLIDIMKDSAARLIFGSVRTSNGYVHDPDVIGSVVVMDPLKSPDQCVRNAVSESIEHFQGNNMGLWSDADEIASGFA